VAQRLPRPVLATDDPIGSFRLNDPILQQLMGVIGVMRWIRIERITPVGPRLPVLVRRP